MPQKEEDVLDKQTPEISEEAKKVLEAILCYYKNASKEKKKEELRAFYKIEEDQVVLMLRNKYCRKNIKIGIQELFLLKGIMQDVKRSVVTQKICIEGDIDGSGMSMWRIKIRN